VCPQSLFNLKTTQPNQLLFNFGLQFNLTYFPGQHPNSINISSQISTSFHCLTCVYILSLALLEAANGLTQISSFVGTKNKAPIYKVEALKYDKVINAELKASSLRPTPLPPLPPLPSPSRLKYPPTRRGLILGSLLINC
jgi:hypothetical protein